MLMQHCDFYPTKGSFIFMCEQVYKTYSGGVCDEAVALSHEESFGKVLDVYEKCLTNRKVSNPTMIEISSISIYECECDMANEWFVFIVLQ